MESVVAVAVAVAFAVVLDGRAVVVAVVIGGWYGVGLHVWQPVVVVGREPLVVAEQ